MIGRADIEESKSKVAKNANLPQAGYPCGNFSNTSKNDISNRGYIKHAITINKINYNYKQIKIERQNDKILEYLR